MAKRTSKTDQKPLVSVIIPCYNSERFIVQCLNSVMAQRVDAPFEVIVVDSSTDATPRIVAEQFPNIILIHRDEKTLPGAGRSIGAQHAQGDIFAFIDSDCIAGVDWLEQALQGLKLGYSVIGGGVHNANSHSWISKADHFLTFNESLPTMPSREVQFMPSCNLACTRSVFEEVGGFDMSLAIGEDTFFCYTAGKEHPLYFNALQQVSHTNRNTFRKFWMHHQDFGKGSAELRRKISLPGSVFVKYPLLALGIPVVRYARISSRMIRWNRQYLLSFMIVSPLVFAGVCAWSWGFIRASLELRR